MARCVVHDASPHRAQSRLPLLSYRRFSHECTRKPPAIRGRAVRGLPCQHVLRGQAAGASCGGAISRVSDLPRRAADRSSSAGARGLGRRLLHAVPRENLASVCTRVQRNSTRGALSCRGGPCWRCSMAGQRLGKMEAFTVVALGGPTLASDQEESLSAIPRLLTCGESSKWQTDGHELHKLGRGDV